MAKDSPSCVPSTSTTDHANTKRDNRRKFIRFSADEHSLVWLQFTESAPKELWDRVFPALVIDESRVSLSCSVVLPDFQGEIKDIIWHESKTIKTLCNVIRVNHLANRVYMVVFGFNE